MSENTQPSTPEYILRLEVRGLADLKDDDLRDLLLDLARERENRMYFNGWTRARLPMIDFITYLEREQARRNEELSQKAAADLATWKAKAANE